MQPEISFQILPSRIFNRRPTTPVKRSRPSTSKRHGFCSMALASPDCPVLRTMAWPQCGGQMSCAVREPFTLQTQSNKPSPTYYILAPSHQIWMWTPSSFLFFLSISLSSMDISPHQILQQCSQLTGLNTMILFNAKRCLRYI